MNATQARADYIAQFAADADALRAELEANRDCEKYVVRCSGLTIDPTVKATGKFAEFVKPLRQAPRFNETTARHFAARCTNGNGDRAEAVRYTVALQTSIDELASIIETLRAVK